MLGGRLVNTPLRMHMELQATDQITPEPPTLGVQDMAVTLSSSLGFQK